MAVCSANVACLTKLCPSVFSMREETPTFGGSVENLTPSEELTHLRRQVAKINRRLLAVEIDSVQRQQREKIIYCVGMAYFLFKTFMWLSRK